jgi:AraC-like DNA-binding protein
MNRATLLHETSDLSVRRFDHPPHVPHDDPEHEVADRWSIAVVLRGSFDVRVEGTQHRLGAGGALLTWPGLAFRYAHAERCPDDVCLSVSFSPHAVGDRAHAWARAGWAARRAPTPRLAHAQRRLVLATDARDAFEIKRWSLAGLTALEADARDARARGPYAVRRTDIDAVLETCRTIESDPVSRLSVAARARAVGMTGPQLTHAFRRYLGLSPHRYVVRWRLAAAAALLDDGASVSESCWRSGFENLSHFCRRFQRALGVRASAWRRLTLAERRRKVQALLDGRS